MAEACRDHSGDFARSVYIAASRTQIRQVVWTDRVTELLTHPTSASLLPWMFQQWKAGIAQLWLFNDPFDALYVITRIDDNPRELCVPYVRGSGLLKFAPLFIEVAKAQGLPLRAHVESPAMVRLLAKLSFRLAEYVVRLEHGC